METDWYQPLPSGRHVRLLHVASVKCDQGEAHDRSIHGMEVFDIDTAPSYHALSYTWGQIKANETITLPRGRKLRVTPNLKTGLPYILRHCKADYLFIDQICINQQDTAERSDQVALMADIYSKAESVLIWLGPRVRHHGVLMWLLEELGDEGKASAFRKVTDKDCTYGGSSRFEEFRLRVVEGYMEELITATLSDVFKSPWFRRVWVTQEAVLASQAVFILGSLAISPLVLREISGTYYGEIGHKFTENVEPARQSFLNMIDMRGEDGIFRTSSHDILVNHCIFAGFHATDPRDYVYAVLGLREHFSDQPLQPDYTLSNAEVFSQAARHFTQYYSDLGVLNLCEGAGHITSADDHPPDLPSWVPNWSKKCDNKSGIYHPGEKLAFSASGERRFVPRQLKTWSELTTSGKVIHHVGKVFTGLLLRIKDFHTGDDPRYWWSLSIDRYQQMFGHLLTEIGLEPSLDVNARLLSLMLQWSRRGGEQMSATGCPSRDLSVLLCLFKIYSMDHSQALDRHIEDDNIQREEAHLAGLLETGCMRGAYCSNRSHKTCRHAQWMYDHVTISLKTLEDDAEIFVTGDGSFGLAHRAPKEDDVIAILQGYDVPAILRKDKEGKYQYVTGCCLENAMYGEAVTWSEDEADEIILV